MGGGPRPPKNPRRLRERREVCGSSTPIVSHGRGARTIRSRSPPGEFAWVWPRGSDSSSPRRPKRRALGGQGDKRGRGGGTARARRAARLRPARRPPAGGGRERGAALRACGCMSGGTLSAAGRRSAQALPGGGGRRGLACDARPTVRRARAGCLARDGGLEEGDSAVRRGAGARRRRRGLPGRLVGAGWCTRRAQPIEERPRDPASRRRQGGHQPQHLAARGAGDSVPSWPSIAKQVADHAVDMRGAMLERRGALGARDLAEKSDGVHIRGFDRRATVHHSSARRVRTPRLGLGGKARGGDARGGRYLIRFVAISRAGRRGSGSELRVDRPGWTMPTSWARQ